MKCALCRPLLSKYVDGEATAAERAQVEAHIGGCEACSRMLVEFRVLRTRVGALPNYRPDPRMRARLFAAIDTSPTAADEIRITRRPADVALRPVRVPARPRGALLGNLASMAALTVVVAAVALVWQIAGNPAGPSSVYATGTAEADGTTFTNLPIQVPTKFVAINNASLPGPQATAQATAIVVAATRAEADAQRTSPTAIVWSAHEDATMVHTARDEAYGYQFQYPAGWWTAAGVAPAGLLARRVLRPWSTQDAEQADYSLTLDVLSNPGQLAPAAAFKDAKLLANWDEHGNGATAQPTQINGAEWFTLSSQVLSAGERRWAAYLFAGTIVYRVTRAVTVPVHNSGTKQAPANADTLGLDVATQVLNSFQPAADAATQSMGYVPLLYLQNGDLWRADPVSGKAQQITHGNQIADFALAPDLKQVALVEPIPGSSWPWQIEVRNLATGASTVLWTTNEIHAVAWYGDQELVALGGAPSGSTPYGLIRLSAQTGNPQPLVNLSKQQAMVKTGQKLAVAPDRRWISFLAANGQGGLDLYGVRPDGTGLRTLLPAGAQPLMTSYAWLPPQDNAVSDRLVLIADHQVDQVQLTGQNDAESRLDVLKQMPNSTFSDLAVASCGEIAALAQGGNQAQVYLHTLQATPGTDTLLNLPAAPQQRSLHTTPGGRYLFFWEASGARMQLFDTATQTMRTLVDASQ